MMIYQGDCREILKTLQAGSVNCCVTSPPYWGLRDYGVDGQLGLEPTPEEYVANMVGVFREVWRVLRDDGTLWLNLGDSYKANNAKQCPQTKQHAGSGFCGPNRGNIVGLKPKDLIGIPWRVALALQADGWYLRSDIIWAKPNPMPESVTDRPTKSHEYIFLLSKNQKYYYDADAIREPWKQDSIDRDLRGYNGTMLARVREAMPGDNRKTGIDGGKGNHAGRNKRTVWNIATAPYKEAHFATFPPKLIEPCIKAGCPPEGTVLDTFNGAGTTGAVAKSLNREYIGIELNPEYIEMSERRIQKTACQYSLF